MAAELPPFGGSGATCQDRVAATLPPSTGSSSFRPVPVCEEESSRKSAQQDPSAGPQNSEPFGAGGANTGGFRRPFIWKEGGFTNASKPSCVAQDSCAWEHFAPNLQFWPPLKRVWNQGHRVMPFHSADKVSCWLPDCPEYTKRLAK